MTERFGHEVHISLMVKLPSFSAEAPCDRNKRDQIMDGARRVFLAQGFDGASMGEIARSAGVSKGTLYVYFGEKRQSAEVMFELDADDHNVPRVLNRLGNSYLDLMLRPGHVASLRAVIGVAEKFPEVGLALFEAGPRLGIERLSGYLASQVEAKVLQIDDVELAAGEYLGMLMTNGVTPTMLASLPPPPPERRAKIIGSAVAVFMAAYGPIKL
jgi:AcrR family transcriptional regulator